MIDIQGITTIIGTLGFPIAACVVLFWQNWKQSEMHKNALDMLSKSQQEMSKQMTEAIQNNTIALSVLSTKIDVFGAAKDGTDK